MKITGRIIFTMFRCPHDTIIRSKYNIQQIARILMFKFKFKSLEGRYESVRIVLPFKEQKSADSVRKQLKDLGKLLNIDLRPVFISRKVGENLKHKKNKPALINEQSVVYKFECG